MKQCADSQQRQRSQVHLGPQDWPEGCCGVACNLVRPTQRGQRSSLLFAMLGQTMARPGHACNPWLLSEQPMALMQTPRMCDNDCYQALRAVCA